jgi:pantoate--beta-alanine ligase
MQTVTTVAQLRELIQTAKSQGMTVGFVPTMGYFHEGHLSLMRRAKQENALVVVSLFVNPIQFGPNEDFSRYPRDFNRDRSLAESVGVDLFFCPEVDEMYPAGFQTTVDVAELAKGMCGASRPGHFRGVATVVLKLLNMVEPDQAYFGEKDAQQLRVIKRMVIDLNLKLEVIGCPIVRESDGLAMSSRNVYLNPVERQASLVLHHTLERAGELIRNGERDAEKLQVQLLLIIKAEPLADLDYLVILDSDTLQPVACLQGTILVALAVRIGKTRLIDNMTHNVKEQE